MRLIKFINIIFPCIRWIKILPAVDGEPEGQFYSPHRTGPHPCALCFMPKHQPINGPSHSHALIFNVLQKGGGSLILTVKSKAQMYKNVSDISMHSCKY